MANPQAWNRYSYVQNGPIILNDPTGHKACGDGEEYDCNGNTQNPNTDPYKPPQPPSDGDEDPDDELSNDGSGDGDIDGLDFHWEIGTHDCDVDCQHTLEGLFVFGTMMDSIATGVNFGFALGADIALLINPLLYAEAVVLYQPLSIIPNIIGSIGGATWIVSGFISGDNSFEITVNDGLINISGSIAQDTIATVIFDGAGWFAREPNIAFSINGAGTSYDLLRNPFDPILPTFFQPSFSFTIDTNTLFP